MSRASPKRLQEINDVCESLRRLWAFHPSLRLGQVMFRYVWEDSRPLAMSDEPRIPRDIYHYEDKETLFAIVKALRESGVYQKPWCDANE